jgi:hypothetical protein
MNSSTGWSTGTTDDVARTLFYDMSNRLVCATSVSGSTSCPTTNTSPFLEAFTYDATDSRLTYRSSSGTTTYAYSGVAMTQEDPPGTYDRRHFHALGNGGVRTSDRDQTLASTTRSYTYDALQRLRQVSLPTTFDERQYVPIGAFAIGELERSWVAGSATRRSYYHAVEPMGLALGAFEFEHPGGPVVSFNPQTSVQRWSSFGMRMYQTGIGTPLPTRFPGQLELRGSDTRIWNGSNTVEYAHGLYLNRWRVYDPRVGQYLQPDPAAICGLGADPILTRPLGGIPAVLAG